jgi:hypothetical protein
MDFEIWWVFAFVIALTGIQWVGRIAVAIIERKKTAPPPMLNDLAEKVDRMSQTVEATAIEVERIGEAQRFLTRVLSDGQPAYRHRMERDAETRTG